MDDQTNNHPPSQPNYWGKALWLLACIMALVLPPGITKNAILTKANQSQDPLVRAPLLIRVSAITPWDQNISTDLAVSLATSPAKAVKALETQDALGWLSPFAEIIYAQSLDKMGEDFQAISILEKLEQEGTLDVGGTLYLASIYHRHANFAREWQVLQGALAKNPNNPQIEWKIKLIQIAFGVEKVVLSQIPDGISPVAFQRLQNAASHPETFSRAISSGIALMGLGENELAQFCFERAVQIQPSVSDAWAWLAISKVDPNNPVPASLAFSRALRAEEKTTQFPLLAGQYYLASAQPKMAAKAFKQATQTEPTSSGAWLGYGLSIADENLVSSLAALQKASELAPSDPEVWQAIAEVCLRNESYIQQTAFPAIEQLISLRPEDPRTWILRARAEIATNDPSGALESLDIAKNLTKSDATHAEALFYKGWLYYLQGDSASSRATFGMVLDQYPQSPFANEAKAILEQIKGSVR